VVTTGCHTSPAYKIVADPVGAQVGMTAGEKGQYRRRADDSDDDKRRQPGINRTPRGRLTAQIEDRREGLHVLVKWTPALIIPQGVGLPPRDRSCDRNEQHRAALEHHPANAACPRRAV
jgi:hypothetical protein